MKNLTRVQRKAIKEKLSPLKKIKEGIVSKQDLADIITERRTNWFKANREQLFKKFGNLTLPDIAYRTIFFSHMKIDPQYSKPSWISKNKLRIESYNFCPYLEACLILQLDTRLVCKIVGEPSIQAICSLIDPRLKFSRNYDHIRPRHPYCEEFIELIL